MREYLFRGMRLGGKGWACGDLINGKSGTFIKTKDCPYPYGVNPETVGQYTGLVDKNGVKIFEGDIVQVDDYNYEEPELDFCGEIITTPYGGHAVLVENEVIYLSDPQGSYKTIYEVLGNIHENPELLGVQE